MVSVVAPTHSLKGKPHWRRTQQVYALLNQAPPEATYDRLIELVRQSTGKGCSRKLISKWKKTVISHQLPVTSKPIQNDQDEPPTGNGNVSLVVISSKQSSVETTLETNQAEAQPIQNPKLVLSVYPERSRREVEVSKIQNPFTERVLQVARSTWSYVAATAIVVGLAGGGWLLSKDNSQPVIAQPAAVTQTAPTPRPQKLEPRTIKIHLTLSNPQDLKVKPGDEVMPGQVLSDRTTERQRLLAQKKQLRLSLNKLDVPIPELIPPEPIPALGKLPPVSYQQEEANIALKQQELDEAERAIANQQEKIHQLGELLPNIQPSGAVQKSSDPEQKLPVIATPSIPSLEPEAEYQNQSMEIIIEHEQAVLSQLKAARDKAKLQLDIAKSQLLTAKERRAHAEYQRYVEESRRAIALQQQRIELERQRSIRAGQIQERAYSKAQIEAKIQEIDNAISNLSTVKAPYPGQIKKVKWTGQDNHNLSVELTLDVDDGSEQQANSKFRKFASLREQNSE